MSSDPETTLNESAAGPARMVPVLPVWQQQPPPLFSYRQQQQQQVQQQPDEVPRHNMQVPPPLPSISASSRAPLRPLLASNSASDVGETSRFKPLLQEHPAMDKRQNDGALGGLSQFHLDAEESENLLDVAGGAEGGAFADLSNPRYKTEICRNFKERARCVYGDSCQFAHGRRELREVVRNTKYKTKLCQKYWITGYCVYGPRCNFLHNERGTAPGQQAIGTR